MSNSTANFTEQLKQKRLVRERQIEKRIMDELDTIEATSLKQLNAGKSTIVKDTLAWSQRRSRHWMRVLALHPAVVSPGDPDPVHRSRLDQQIHREQNERRGRLPDRSQEDSSPRPDNHGKEDGRLQIQISREGEQETRSMVTGEKNDLWVVDIWRK